MMKFLKSRRKLVLSLCVLVLVVLAFSAATAFAHDWPFADVDPASPFYYNIRRIAYLNISPTGCGGGNFCPGAPVLREQMAAYMDRFTRAWTDEDEPYIINVDHRAISVNRPAIIGQSNDGNGVNGISYGAGVADNGVYGETNSTDGFEGGLYGRSTSYASGVIGISTSGAGSYFEGAIGIPDVVMGSPGTGDDGDLWCDPNKNDCDLFLHSNDEVWVNLDESNDTAASFIVFNGANAQVFRVDETTGIYGNWTNQDADTYFRSRDILTLDLDDTNDSTYNGVLWVRDETDNVEFWVNTFGDASLDNNMYIAGNLSVGGAKSSVAETSEGRRLLYALESPENWFEDFGSAQLVDGAAIVNIDPLFLETVNAEVAYYVYLTPLGDCNGLYVANKTPTSFEVHELGGGTSSIAFDYRIVAKRLGYEDVRLAKAGEIDEDGIVGYDETDPVVGSEVDDELPTPGEPTLINMSRTEEIK